MSAYPHRGFKMATLVKSINPSATAQEKKVISRGILRVLKSLKESNHITTKGNNNQSKYYQWVT